MEVGQKPQPLGVPPNTASSLTLKLVSADPLWDSVDTGTRLKITPHLFEISGQMSPLP